MKKIHADQGPRLTMEVSERERSVAKDVKKEFKGILSELGDALRLIYDLRDAIVRQRPSREDLKDVYRGRLLRYRRKIVKEFNNLLGRIKSALEMLSSIMDPDMANLRKIIVAEFDELSDGIEGVLDLLEDSDREGFTKSLERLATQMESRKITINEIIDNQLFNHLEYDVLGKMKISSIKAQIRKRIRILQKISMENDTWHL